MKRILLVLIAVVAILLGGTAVFLRQVGSDEMGWTLRQGDLVLIVPDTVYRGDVVLLPDPLDPGRKVLRRVFAVAGQKIRFEDGAARLDGKMIRQSDMGNREQRNIFKEVMWSRPPARATAWYVTRTGEPTRWSMKDAITIPEGHAYLLADDRDQAMDSRWWGPVPVERFEGVVRARIGPSDDWRGPVSWLKPVDQPDLTGTYADGEKVGTPQKKKSKP